MKRLICFFLLLCFLPVACFAEESADSVIVGKWSFYLDATRLHPEYQKVFQKSLLVYDLYLFADNSAYMTQATIDKGKSSPTFSYSALDGVWYGSADDFIVHVGSQTYKATISDGVLLLYMTEKLPLPFVKVDCTDAFVERLH